MAEKFHTYVFLVIRGDELENADIVNGNRKYKEVIQKMKTVADLVTVRPQSFIVFRFFIFF